MKRILAITLTLVMLLAALTGCMASKNLSGLEGEQKPSKGENSTQLQKPPVPGEIIDLQINSIDKLNYYAAIRMISGTPNLMNQSMAGGHYGISLLTAGFDTDKTEVQLVPETTGPEETQGPPVTPDSPASAESEDDIYYYELDPDQPFFINKVSKFQIELTDGNGFLASKLGLGIVDVVISEDCIWGDSLITFCNGEKFFSCLTNGWSLNQETGGCQWDFSTHKYVEGFFIIKNFEQENYAFYIDMDAQRQVTAFECRESQNGGYRADQNVNVVSSTVISTQSSSFTVAELEDYFNNDSVL